MDGGPVPDQWGGTLVLSNLQVLPVSQQSRMAAWLKGEGALFPEQPVRPSGGRVLAMTSQPEGLWPELLFQFAYHLQLPSLNEVAEDIPYHLKRFLSDKPVHYLRYFFLLKTFFHQWGGSLLELAHYLDQALAYYRSMSLVPGFSGGEEVFGEKRLRFYQDILKGEWWYYPVPVCT